MTNDKNTAKGFLCLVLHAHLPYVRHPEYENFLEEDWFFEALTESYIPLIQVIDNLILDNIKFRLTISLSPPLLCMMEDFLLQERYVRHLKKLIELSEREIDRTRNDTNFHSLAIYYHQMFSRSLTIFEDRYDGRLLSAFKKFQNQGVLEIITTSATHALMPLLKVEPSAVRGQILTAIEHFDHLFGRPPAGIWLPECGYYPGLDELLHDAGFKFFFTETHGITNADQSLKYGTLAPIACPSGIAAFGRDEESSRQVWSSTEGYPGDPDYREFYRDIGFDLDFNYIKPYIHDGRIRVNTGIKYYRITGNTDNKKPYDPETAAYKACIHAHDFLSCRIKQIESHAMEMDNLPIVTAPYDAELFGHWWFEGPLWLDALIRKIYSEQDTLCMITPSEYLEQYPPEETATPAPSTWGMNGYYEFWLNEENDWIYPHIHQTARRMRKLVRFFKDRPPDSLAQRALNQAARSLLLAQSSDWAFIMKTGTTVDYAYRRVKDQLARFYYLEEALYQGNIDSRKLRALEIMDNIFPETIDYKHFGDG
jgi:1,4-alpha-glucan branching enzyme